MYADALSVFLTEVIEVNPACLILSFHVFCKSVFVSVEFARTLAGSVDPISACACSVPDLCGSMANMYGGSCSNLWRRLKALLCLLRPAASADAR